MHIKRNIDTKIVTILVGIVILSGCVLSNTGSINNTAVYATNDTSNTTKVSVTVSDSCTMSVSGDQGTLGSDGNYIYSATIQGGTTDTITANSIKTFCNDFNGFSIYAIGYSDDVYGNTDLVYSNGDTYNIKTDASGIYDSYWKMKLANNNSSVPTIISGDYENFNVIPNDYTLVAKYESNTGNTDAASSIITPTYQVHIASAQPAGTYTGKVKYTLVHPNMADAPEKPVFGGITTMQEMTPEICAATRTPDASETTTVPTKTLTDIRDGKTYTVSKLPDGNCWMTQNLALGSSSLGEITLTSADSDVSSDFTLPVPTTTSFSSSSYDVVNYRNYTSKNTNYYNWYTATAGTGTQSTAAYTASTGSICPKGWRLPNGSFADDMPGEWGELFYAAGITDNKFSADYMTGGVTKIAAAPYNIPYTYGLFQNAGNPTNTMTSFWTNRVTYDADHVWTIRIRANDISSNVASYFKYYGLPIRCVAHKSEIQPVITYNANGGTGAPVPTQATGAASEFVQKVTLSSVKPTKSGQAFVGWNTKADGTGDWYYPDGIIKISNNITLYAIWWEEATSFDSAFEAAGKIKLNGYYKMQDMDTSICNSVTQFSELTAVYSTQLIDIRDNKVYWVSKLADGKCWMTQNLDLDLSASKELTPDDTDIDFGVTFPTTIVKDGLSSSNWVNVRSFDGGDVYLPEGMIITACTKKDFTTCSFIGQITSLSDSSIRGNENAHYHVGNHYTWQLATYSNADRNYVSPYSICPKGWRLPDYRTEFQELKNVYGSTINGDILRAKPFYFVRSGIIGSSAAVNNGGSVGGYWASRIGSTIGRPDTLYINGINISMQFGDIYVPHGFSVRCVAR